MTHSVQEADPRRVLLISFHFPPSAAVGGIRAANFAKYLPESGWQPTVLTIGEDDLESRDDSRLASLADVRVLRASQWPTLIDAYRSGKRVVTRFRNRPTARSTSRPPDYQPKNARAGLRRLLLSLLYLPDGDRGWIVPAVVRALWEIRTRNIQCVVTSCPPYSAHLVGMVVKLLTGVRWVADFRDPWMSGGRKALYVTSDLSLWLDRWLERKVIKGADVVVANTPQLCEALRRGHPDEAATKFVSLTNSIDLAQFAPFWDLAKDPVFTITYAGALYFNRTPEPLFAAVRRLIDDRGVEPGMIRIRLIGHCNYVGDLATIEIARRYGLERVVAISPPVSYPDVLAMVRRSHVALVLAPTQPNQVPAKTYDYIGVGTEVLALAPHGATADLVTRYSVGRAYAPEDLAGITAYIWDAFRRASTPGSDALRNVRDLDARSITPRLAAMLFDPARTPQPCELAPVSRNGRTLSPTSSEDRVLSPRHANHND